MERQGRTREKYEGFYLLEGNRRPREAVCREGTSQELDFRKKLAITLEIG